LHEKLAIKSLNNLKLMRDMKRDLIRNSKEIDKINSGKRKLKAMKVYAELLTTLEFGEAN